MNTDMDPEQTTLQHIYGRREETHLKISQIHHPKPYVCPRAFAVQRSPSLTGGPGGWARGPGPGALGEPARPRGPGAQGARGPGGPRAQGAQGPQEARGAGGAQGPGPLSDTFKRGLSKGGLTVFGKMYLNSIFQILRSEAKHSSALSLRASCVDRLGA